jgi:hypothetical protein
MYVIVLRSSYICLLYVKECRQCLIDCKLLYCVSFKDGKVTILLTKTLGILTYLPMLISKTINSAPGTIPSCIILIFCIRAPEDIIFNHAFAVINFFK